MKEEKILLSELRDIYRELCQARKPLINYELDADEQMMRQAMFIKDMAINKACVFLYNKGIDKV